MQFQSSSAHIFVARGPANMTPGSIVYRPDWNVKLV
jgi:hypothetical protein